MPKYDSGQDKGAGTKQRGDGGEIFVSPAADGNITLTPEQQHCEIEINGAIRTVTLPSAALWSGGRIAIYRYGDAGTEDLNVVSDGKEQSTTLADNINTDLGFAIYQNFNGKVIAKVASQLA